MSTIRKSKELKVKLSEKREAKIERYQYRINTKVFYSLEIKRKDSVHSIRRLSREDLNELVKAINQLDKDFEKH